MAAKGSKYVTKYTPEVHKALVDCIGMGMSKKMACDAAGVTTHCFYIWLRRGRDGELPELAKLFTDVKKAAATGVYSRLKRIEDAAKGGNWQADAWWLERVCPERFGKNRVEVTELLRLLRKMEADRGVPASNHETHQAIGKPGTSPEAMDPEPGPADPGAPEPS